MVTLHAHIIKKDGKKEYAVLPYDEFFDYVLLITQMIHHVPQCC